MPDKKSQQEGVIIIFDAIPEGEGKPVKLEPAYMVRKNGEVVYYKLEKMSFGDHAEMLGADKPTQS
jgi:hypothetical protein